MNKIRYAKRVARGYWTIHADREFSRTERDTVNVFHNRKTMKKWCEVVGIVLIFPQGPLSDLADLVKECSKVVRK